MTSGSLYNSWHRLSDHAHDWLWFFTAVILAFIGAIAVTPCNLLIYSLWPDHFSFSLLSLAVPILCTHIAFYLVLKKYKTLFSQLFFVASLMSIFIPISSGHSGTQLFVTLYTFVCNFISMGIVANAFFTPNVNKVQSLIRLYGMSLIIVSIITVALSILAACQLIGRSQGFLSYSEFLVLFVAIISAGICYIGRMIYTGAKDALPYVA